MTAVSVITITKDRNDHLANLCDGLFTSARVPSELIVVDMGSADPPSSVLEPRLDRMGEAGIEIIQLASPTKQRLPLAAARNSGAAVARSELLIFLDVDCIPSPDLVSAYAQADPHPLTCGPVRYLPRCWRSLCPMRTPAEMHEAAAPHPLRPAPPHTMIDDRYELFWSLSFATSRETWEVLGGFDEEFTGYGGEDTDLAFTARDRGVPLQWLSDGVAYHQWHPTQDPPIDHAADIVRNARRFHEKWGEWPMRGWLDAFEERGIIQWSGGEPSLVSSNGWGHSPTRPIPR